MLESDLVRNTVAGNAGRQQADYYQQTDAEQKRSMSTVTRHQIVSTLRLGSKSGQSSSGSTSF